MNDLQRPLPSDEDAEIEKHQDRFAAWDVIHVAWCADKKLPPWRIAERIGTDTATVRAILEEAKSNCRGGICYNKDKAP